MAERREPRKVKGLGVPMPAEPLPDVVEVAPGLEKAIREYVAAAPNLGPPERDELAKALADYIRATAGRAWVRFTTEQRERLNELLRRAGLPEVEPPS